MTPSPRPDDRNTMPAASSAFRTASRVASRTKSRSDSSRFNAVSATQGLVREQLLGPAQERPRGPDLPGGDHS
jgi:hypothetical protein